MKALLRIDRTTPDLRGRWSHAQLTLGVIVLLVGSTGTTWSQESIGSTVIVINTVEGTIATSTVPVAQGDPVYRDEGVRTRVDSKAGLLMEDKTKVTIGPSSTLKLDRFVYAGAKKSGTIVLNLAQGTARLVIGDANKRSYTIVTPTAAIGVRD